MNISTASLGSTSSSSPVCRVSPSATAGGRSGSIETGVTSGQRSDDPDGRAGPGELGLDEMASGVGAGAVLAEGAAVVEAGCDGDGVAERPAGVPLDGVLGLGVSSARAAGPALKSIADSATVANTRARMITPCAPLPDIAARLRIGAVELSPPGPCLPRTGGVEDGRMTDFAQRLRHREELIGYWVMLDSPFATERLAGLGYDYLAVDAQHGLLGYDGMVRALLAVHAGTTLGPVASAGVVRVESAEPTAIGKALDAGAEAVIIPLVDDAEQAAAAVRAARYPPVGIRSFGPLRSQLRVGPVPEDTHRQTAVVAMIETAAGLANVAEICATPGLDGVYVGPSDLSIGLGARFAGDPAVAESFERALVAIARAAEAAGIAAGIHTEDGAVARRRLDQGYTFATVAGDLSHLVLAASDHLGAARPS